MFFNESEKTLTQEIREIKANIKFIIMDNYRRRSWRKKLGSSQVREGRDEELLPRKRRGQRQTHLKGTTDRAAEAVEILQQVTVVTSDVGMEENMMDIQTEVNRNI